MGSAAVRRLVNHQPLDVVADGQFLGGADGAAELDAKRAIDQGSRLAAEI